MDPQRPQGPAGAWRIGDLELNPARRTLLRAGAALRVGSRAFDLLHALALSHPEPLASEALARRVWGDAGIDLGNVRVQVAALRRQFGADLIRHDAVRGYSLGWPVAAPQDAAPPTPGNLPEHAVALTARHDELSRLDRALREPGARVTLTGAPGIGKTVLALAAAQRLRGHHREGAWLVELAALEGGSEVCAHAATVLGLPADAAASPQRFARALGERPLLLLLDNCEHVHQAVQALCDALLRDAPAVTVLATSRRALKCAGEDVLALQPLSVPADDSLAAAQASQAVALFADRARRADPRFALTTANAAAVCRIGRLLDGVPLAIGFAAARVSLWGVEGLSRRLEQPAGALVPPLAGQTPRHQTPQQTIRWSYELLSASGQALMAVLGAFSGTVPLAALQQVAAEAGLAPRAVTGGVGDLLENSLLTADAAALPGAPAAAGGVAAGPRYAMHALVRDFAHDLLQARPDAAALHRAHARWCSSLIDDVAPGAPRRPLDAMPPPHGLDNLRKAIRWASAHDVPLAMDLSSRMAPFWRARGMYREGLDAMLPLLEHAPPEGQPLLRLRLRNRFCGLLFEAEQTDRLLATAQDTVQQALAAGNDVEAADALSWIGVAEAVRGDNPAAGAAFEESLRLARRAGDVVTAGSALCNAGAMAIELQRAAEGMAMLEEAIEIGRRIDDPFMVATAHAVMGEHALLEGRAAEAAAHAGASVAAYRRIDMAYNVINSSQLLALALLAQGQLDKACATMLEMLQAALRHRYDRFVAESLVCVAGLLLAHGQAQRSRALLLAGDRQLEAAGMELVGTLAAAAERWRRRLEATALPDAPLPTAAAALQWMQELQLRGAGAGP